LVDRAQLSEIVQRIRDGRLRRNIGNVSTLDEAVAALNPTEPHRKNDHPRSSVRTSGDRDALRSTLDFLTTSCRCDSDCFATTASAAKPPLRCDRWWRQPDAESLRVRQTLRIADLPTGTRMEPPTPTLGVRLPEKQKGPCRP